MGRTINFGCGLRDTTVSHAEFLYAGGWKGEREKLCDFSGFASNWEYWTNGRLRKSNHGVFYGILRAHCGSSGTGDCNWNSTGLW